MKILDEKFDQAKRYKAALELLKKARHACNELAEEKDDAIENEDYDTAEDLKVQMDLIRDNVYQEVDIWKLFDSQEEVRSYFPMKTFVHSLHSVRSALRMSGHLFTQNAVKQQ